MAYRHRNSPNRRLCRIGASVLIAVHAAGSLADAPLAAAAAQRAPAKAPAATAHAAECAAALRRSLERVPELLALADWPLDRLPPAACRPGTDAPAAAVPSAVPLAAAVPPAAPIAAAVRPAAPVAAAAAGTNAVAIAMPVSLAMPRELPAAGGAEASLTTIAEQVPVVLVIAGGADAPVSARAWVDETVAAPFGALAALDHGSLDEIRGGFEPADSQLRFSFGIERAVFINGELITTTVLNLRDLQWTVGVGPAPEVATSGLAGAVGVIQNGGGNAVPAQLGADLAGTVIQNTLDNQAIQTVTTVNAAVNSAQILRTMSVQSAVQNGLVNSLRH